MKRVWEREMHDSTAQRGILNGCDKEEVVNRPGKQICLSISLWNAVTHTHTHTQIHTHTHRNLTSFVFPTLTPTVSMHSSPFQYVSVFLSPQFLAVCSHPPLLKDHQ